MSLVPGAPGAAAAAAPAPGGAAAAPAPGPGGAQQQQPDILPPRDVMELYREVMKGVREACKDDFRHDGIEQSVLDTLVQLWTNSLNESRVMHDDGIGRTDRKGNPRAATVQPRAARRRRTEQITAEMKRQLEDIVMLCADAVVTARLTQLLQQHSSAAATMTPMPGSIKILQANGWNGNQFLGRVDGTLLRKVADQLVTYIHKTAEVAPPNTAPLPPGAQLGGAAAAAPAAAAALPAAPGATFAGSVPQLDGAGGVGDDDGPSAKRARYADYSDDDEEEEEQAGQGAAAAAAAAASGSGDGAESDLNSDDDDIEEEDDETTSVILCQYTKRIGRQKTKYTGELQNGVMRLHVPGSTGELGKECEPHTPHHPPHISRYSNGLLAQMPGASQHNLCKREFGAECCGLSVGRYVFGKAKMSLDWGT